MPKVVLLNKPFNVLSQFRDAQDRDTVARYISDSSLRIAGRLDRDSEGLLVLCDDGTLVQKITHPDKQMSKTYWIQVEGIADDTTLEPITNGSLILRDGPVRAAKIQQLDPSTTIWPRHPPIRQRKTVPTSWLTITLTEGRNRQVRRMMAAVGLPVLRLIRYRVGSWTIDGLAPGDSIQLNL